MAKTKPIGVRFDEELLKTLQGATIATSPQKALNLYEKSYLELVQLKIKINNEPENKKRIEDERDETSEKRDQKIDEGFDNWRNQERIKELEKELANPPKSVQIGVKNWIRIRENELKKLK